MLGNVSDDWVRPGAGAASTHVKEHAEDAYSPGRLFGGCLIWWHKLMHAVLAIVIIT
jgi:hypothetical protein